MSKLASVIIDWLKLGDGGVVASLVASLYCCEDSLTWSFLGYSPCRIFDMFRVDCPVARLWVNGLDCWLLHLAFECFRGIVECKGQVQCSGCMWMVGSCELLCFGIVAKPSANVCLCVCSPLRSRHVSNLYSTLCLSSLSLSCFSCTLCIFIYR